jgi:hypothetical protein
MKETPQSPSYKSINPSVLDMTTNNMSIELRDTIEHLCQYLFEFLKQGLKTINSESMTNGNAQISSSMFKSPPTSPSNERPISDSTILTLTYSQYTQVWNLIEYTMNVNLNMQTQHKNQQQYVKLGQLFQLPKEAYLNMFQEINNYANNTNQTYLIDSGINTSQLRRKHHFMVMLKSLKFKFQLFIINLLK